MKLLTPEEVAEQLHVSRSTARRMIIDGSLPSVPIRSGKRKKVVRVRAEVLDRWIIAQERQSSKTHTRGPELALVASGGEVGGDV